MPGPPWRYEPDESPHPKHQGRSTEAEFVQRGDEIVGLCPTTISLAQAEAALNSGYRYNNARDNSDHPSRIYAVIDGVVYRATPTNPGASYHGFPEMPEKFKPYGKLSRDIMTLAEREGPESEEKVRRWLKRCAKA